MMWQHQVLIASACAYCVLAANTNEHLARRDRVAPVTLMPRDQPSPASITLAPKTEYNQPAPNAPKIEGSEISLVPGNNGDAYLYFPEDLQKKAEAARNDHCADHGSSDCKSAVDKAIQPSEEGLKKRFLVTAGAIALIASAVMELASIVVISLGALGVIHLGEKALEALSSAQASPTKVYATSANDPNPITVTSTASNIATAESASFTVAAEANDAHDKGDTLLKMSPNLGAGITGLIDRFDSCAAKKDLMKRGVPDSCFTDIATGLMMQAVEDGPVEDLQLAIPTIPEHPIDIIARYIPLVIAAARNNPVLAALGDLKGLATAATFCVFAVVIAGQVIKSPVTELNVHPKETPKPTSTSKDCPEKSVAPDCNNCGGDKAISSICDGVATATFHYKGCECYREQKEAYTPFNAATFSSYQSLLANVGTMKPSPTKKTPPEETQTGWAQPEKGIPDTGRYAVLIENSIGPNGKGGDGKDIWFRVNQADEDDIKIFTMVSTDAILRSDVGARSFLADLPPGNLVISLKGDPYSEDQSIDMKLHDETDQEYAFNSNDYSFDPATMTTGMQFWCEPAKLGWQKFTDQPTKLRFTKCHVNTKVGVPDNRLIVYFTQSIYTDGDYAGTWDIEWDLWGKQWGQHIAGKSTAPEISDDHGIIAVWTPTISASSPMKTGDTYLHVKYGNCDYINDKIWTDIWDCTTSDWSGTDTAWVRTIQCNFRINQEGCGTYEGKVG